LRIVPASQLRDSNDGSFVRVAGLVLVRQRPGTAKGITFVTIEDETGVANLIIRMDVWEPVLHSRSNCSGVYCPRPIAKSARRRSRVGVPLGKSERRSE